MIGSIQFQGADGTNLVQGANIRAQINGTPAANDMPTELIFSVTKATDAVSTDRMRIEPDGELLTFSDSNFKFKSARTSSSQSILVAYSAATGLDDGTQRFRVEVDGDVSNSTGVYGTIGSDERFKKDIVDANSQWDDIKRIEIKNFKYKDSEKVHLGVIAQQARTISPGIIPARSAEEDDVTLSQGTVELGDEVYGFNNSILYMKAVKALQEAMTRIETLEAKVAALEAE